MDPPPPPISHNVDKSRRNTYINSIFIRRITPRFVFYWITSINCFTKKSAILGSVLFTIIAMTVSILIICLTAYTPRMLFFSFLLNSLLIQFVSDFNHFSGIQCQIAFKQVTEVSIINNPHPLSVAVGDFNNDSWLDIAVANSGTNKIGIFLGYGNGSFSTSMTYSTGATSYPISIGVGDFNNDHWLDIVVANYHSHTVGVLLGQSDGTFDNQIELFIGSSRPSSVAVGDFNNDTWLDIVVANNGTQNIGVLLGNGNGSFRMPITYSTGYDSLPYCVAVGDFNNDNKLDIAVANYGTNNVGIFLGDGNGTFGSQITFLTSLRSGPYSITVADVDNDDQLDIIVANYHANTVDIFLGQKNGILGIPNTYFLGSGFNPCSVAMGYFNKDNLLDIVVSNNGTNSISVLLGIEDGTFTLSTIHSIGDGSSPIGLATGDFDNDQQSDVVVANSGTNNIVILTGYNAISLENPPAYSTGDGSLPWQVAINDFNNDNRMDIAVVDYGTNSIGILLGYGNGNFGKQISFYTGDGSRPRGFAIVDVNNDSFLDIVVVNFNVGYGSVLLGYGNGSFNVIKSFYYDEYSSPMFVAVGDFNNDSRPDIVLPSFGYNTITIYLGYGNGSFEYLTTYPTGDGSRPNFAAVADFNNDSYLDIVVANTYVDNIGIFLGYGNGTFAAQTTYSTGDASAPQNVGLGDFNNDKCLDIAVANSNSYYVDILLGYCNGTFSIPTMVLTNPGHSPFEVTVADVNNDQWLDVVFADVNYNSVGVLLGYGNGTFAMQLTFSSGSDSVPYWVAVGDLNNDELMDVVTANHGTNNIALLFGHSNTIPGSQLVDTTNLNSSSVTGVPVVKIKRSVQLNLNVSYGNADSISDFELGDYYLDFQNEIFYSTGSSSSPYSIVVGDFNNDNYGDIVVSNSGSGNVGIILGYGNETFTTETTYPIGSGSRPQQLISGDFNKDTHLDIAVINSLGDSISVLLGYGNGSFAEQLSTSTCSGSKPSSIAIGDINNDSWLDLIITEMGTDTVDLMLGFNHVAFRSPVRSSTGYLSGPVLTAIGDFNNDGRLDIATANYNINNVGILLGYGNGSFTAPIMYAYIDGSHPWALATDDFNHDNKLDIIIALWGINQMGVMLGNGDGTFGELILYSTGSGTRPLSIAIGDFNNDNHLDITTANYGTGTVSVFLGYGNGTFTNATMFSTGIGSGPSSINVDDLDKDSYLDIIVANEVTYNVGVLYGNNDGTFQELTTYLAGPNTAPEYALSGDFNNDNLPDMAVALYGSGDVGVFLGYGNRTFSPITLYTSGFDSGAQYLVFYDFNDDTYVDIAVANLNTGDIGILYGYGDGRFRSIDLYSVGTSNAIYSIVIADINNDKIVDAIFTDATLSEVGVVFRSGFKPFGGSTSLLYANGSSPSSVAIGDINNDACLDIAIANFGSDNVGVLLGLGNGTFEDIMLYSTGKDSQPISIALGDFNNDTLLDIAVANSKTNNIGIFITSNNGTSANLTTYSTKIASNPVSITIADFSNDGFLDIIVANSGSNSVGILFGYGNGSFADQISYQVGYNSRPNWVAFGDFNSDGWIDVAVANYGADTVEILGNCPLLNLNL
jgi:predicted nucleotidyltransferase